MQTSSLLLFPVLVTVLSSVKTSAIPPPEVTSAPEGTTAPLAVSDDNRRTDNIMSDSTTITVPHELSPTFLAQIPGTYLPNPLDKEHPQPSVNNRQRREINQYWIKVSNYVQCFQQRNCPDEIKKAPLSSLLNYMALALNEDDHHVVAVVYGVVGYEAEKIEKVILGVPAFFNKLKTVFSNIFG